ncbi:DUF6939 family protein [Bartonella sp. HY761]|uniref:DUF6939 family protein n=1 Tax=Bartonella sp. HY761 TaxID=2979330 RepID=UPI0021E31D86|nr:hypothetical protein [Bartonella sp. HY761]UXN08151.1 hypothetical protein N6A79_15775 [Bartonella sp. HY761]
MAIKIMNKRARVSSIDGESIVLDVTSKGTHPWIKFSPFFPIGRIPVPFSDSYFSYTVEGIWQGLKVFDNDDVDIKLFQNRSMKHMKRTERKYGKTKGHRRGVDGEIIDYLQAKKDIYIPSYRYILDNYLSEEIKLLRDNYHNKEIILLDYNTSSDPLSLVKPISHAYLIKYFVEGDNVFESNQF